VKPAHIAQMLDLIDGGVISGKIAKTVFEEMFQTGRSAQQIVEEAGLTQISASDELAAVVEKALAANAKAVRDYQSGKEEALRFLVGQVMRETRGRANPDLVNQILRQKLAGED
jgi:aspartyl-tRNA(Asn)/glutamyl-tRNA(Gln) amidotransferase subunit B